MQETRRPEEADVVRYFSEDSDLIDRTGISDEDMSDSVRVMEALQRWQEASRALSSASQRFMHLNDSDMRAIRMVMRAQKAGLISTPKDIASAVGISSASTTKLIDRLVSAGHMVRVPHPTDRRTMCIEVTEHTRISARNTVGRQHARRLQATAAMTASDRDAVVRFLDALTEADRPQADLLGH